MFGRRLDDARAAVYRFLFDLLDPGDEFFVLAFNHQPRVLTPWTHSANVVQTALDGVQAWGGTSAYDAVLEALPLVARRHRERAALVLISDGADTASNSSVRDVVSALHRSDTFLYAIAIDPPERQAINTRVNPTTLRELTNQSGGRTEVVQTTADLNDASARIAEELNHQYVFGYTSTRAADGRFHSIRVRIAGANHKVSTRSGYVADRRYRRE
jgi:VWFA-related protein